MPVFNYEIEVAGLVTVMWTTRYLSRHRDDRFRHEFEKLWPTLPGHTYEC